LTISISWVSHPVVILPPVLTWLSTPTYRPCSTPLIPQLVSEGRYLIELPVSLTFIYLLYIYLFYLPLPLTLFYVLILILKPYVFIQIDLANQVSFQTTYFLKVSYSLKVIQLKLHLNWITFHLAFIAVKFTLRITLFLILNHILYTRVLLFTWT